MRPLFFALLGVFGLSIILILLINIFLTFLRIFGGR
jgi:hypothetical protein